MSFDRQAIERRDFPIGRRGYDPAAVDAHLRALANEIEALERAQASAGAESSLAATAGTQVQSILQAAETAAAEIERDAQRVAKAGREEAERDAQQTRAQAIERARSHVTAVERATAALLERVSSIDAEVSALADSLRNSAGRLAGDLAALDASMEELYDATAGAPSDASTTRAVGGERAAQPSIPTPPSPAPRQPTATVAATAVASSSSAAPPAASRADENGDFDSARLVALNMALNGESRADTDRYLAENFQLSDREQLVADVYAAIEG